MIASLVMRLVAGAALMLLVLVLSFLFEGADRIVHARMQRRWGPPLFQPFFDLLKLLGKENIVPRRAVPWAFNGAPWVAAASMLLVFLPRPVSGRQRHRRKPAHALGSGHQPAWPVADDRPGGAPDRAGGAG